MPVEIERKFLVRSPDWTKQSEKAVCMQQGYLNTHPERTTRVRVAGEKAFLTIKGKTTSISRKEFEYEIPSRDAEALLQLCETAIVSKTRHIVIEGKHTWEIDVFDAENEGLILAEIELDSEEEQFEKPEWLGQEVSADKRYFNSYLSKNPFKNW